jgi:hypothetical protein
VNTRFFSIECSGLYTGLKEMAGERQITLYPNPAKNSVTLEYLNSDFSYALVNMLGQAILKDDGLKNKTTIDLQGVSSGIYFIEVKSGNDTFVRKLIVE